MELVDCIAKLPNICWLDRSTPARLFVTSATPLLLFAMLPPLGNKQARLGDRPASPPEPPAAPPAAACKAPPREAADPEALCTSSLGRASEADPRPADDSRGRADLELASSPSSSERRQRRSNSANIAATIVRPEIVAAAAISSRRPILGPPNSGRLRAHALRARCKSTQRA